MQSLAIVVLAVAVVVLALTAEGRHRRQRRRLARLERTEAELLLLVKAIASREASARLAAVGREARMPVEFRSQFGEDLWLWNLFDGKTDGFFIECGAFDGYTYAVSFVFEAMGWRGLLVEPIPERFEACRARRPGSRVVHAALSRRGSSGTAMFVHLDSPTRHYEASSYLAGAAGGKRLMRPPRTAERQITVPLTTMDDLLAQHPPGGGVDFVVLDVEGGELDLLDGFDLDRYRPRAILIEDHAMGRDTVIRDHLAGRGYEHVVWISYNRLMIRRDEPALLDRARRLAQEGPAIGAGVA